jgi:YbbR domain-containing protein
MFKFVGRLVTENFALKIVSLFLAVGVWFYVVSELNKGTLEERLAIQQILPSYGMITKKLQIKPIVVGRPKRYYRIVEEKIVVVPDYCIVVGPKSILHNVKYIYTLPIDVTGVNKPVTKTVPLKPIASGIYMEETLVAATVPVEQAQ